MWSWGAWLQSQINLKGKATHFVLCHTHFLTYSGIHHTYFLALLPLDFLAMGLADSMCPFVSSYTRHTCICKTVYCTRNRSCGGKRRKKEQNQNFAFNFSSLRNVNGTLQVAFVIFLCKPLCISICYGCHRSCSRTLMYMTPFQT